jgi:hypothetical protein
MTRHCDVATTVVSIVTIVVVFIVTFIAFFAGIRVNSQLKDANAIVTKKRCTL